MIRPLIENSRKPAKKLIPVKRYEPKAIKFKIGGRMSKNADYPPGRTEALIPLLREKLGDEMIISHRLGKKSSPESIGNELKNYQGMTDAFERFQAHLDANEINISKEKAALGPLLTMDPDKEEFTGPRADEANKLLTKKYRKSFGIAGAEFVG